MKKTVLATLFTWSMLGLFAQKGPPEAYTDALQRAQKCAVENLDSAVLIARWAMQLAEKLDSPALIFRAQRTIGYFYEDQNRFEEAKKAYADAMDLAEKRLSQRDQLKIYTDWAIVHKKMGDLQTARAFHLKTIEKGSAAADWEMVENGYHGLGTLFSMMSDFEESAKCYHLSIAAAEKWGNRKGIALSQQNLGNIYWKAKNYPMAKKNIEIAQKMAEELGDSLRIAATLKISANIAAALGNVEEAREHHELALRFFEKLGNKAQQSESWLALADLFFGQNDLKKAADALERCAQFEAFFSPYTHAFFWKLKGKTLAARGQQTAAIEAFRRSLEKTKNFGFKEIAREDRLELAKSYHFLSQPDSAYTQLLAANVLSESIFEDQKQKAMTAAQFKFDVAKRDFQIAEQAKELRLSRWVRGLLAAGFLIVGLLLVFSRKQMKMKQKALAHAELLMSELHHRVKNNLQTITSMMRMQARQIDDPKVLAALNESRFRLETISILHQQLYVDESTKSVNMERFCAELIEKLCLLYGIEREKLATSVVFDPPEMDVDRAIPLGIILNELLTNSFKYAFSKQPLPRIEVSFLKKQLLYSDNGPGFSEQKVAARKSFGHHLIGSLAKQLKATHTFLNADGLRFEMRLP